MKILMTADTVGGVWTYALELIRALAPHNVAVVLATMGAPLSEEQRAQAVALTNLEVEESRFALEWMPEPWDDVHHAGDWLLELEAQFRPDVIHLNGYVHGSLPWRAPMLMTAHSDVLSWFRAVKGQARPPEWNRYRDEVQRGLNGAAVLIAPTQAVLDGMRADFKLPSNTRFIPNARDAAGFQAKPKEPFIFAAGRLWDEAKNLKLLDEVAPRLPWPVYVAGDSEHPAGGKVQARGVKMLGHLSELELRDWMSRAAIYCLPAKYEPFGLSVLEAALCGCAPVLGDIRSLREVWGHNALYVAPNDVRSLEKKLRYLIDNPQFLRHYAEHAHACALQYAPQRMARKYGAAYRDLLQAHRTRLKRAAIHS